MGAAIAVRAVDLAKWNRHNRKLSPNPIGKTSKIFLFGSNIRTKAWIGIKDIHLKIFH
jgi:hypothetical protein